MDYNQQIKTISGSIYDVYNTDSQGYKDNTMPRVGQKCEFEDGRKFVFVSSAVDITAGQVVGAPTEGVELTAVTAAYAAGTKEVAFVLAGQTLNLLADGYLTVTLGTGVGYTYRIKSNTASATVSSVSNTVICQLYDPIKVGITATDNVIVKQYRCASVLVGTAALDNVGVSCAAAPAATGSLTYFFWAQTGGIGYAEGSDVASNLNLVVGAAGTLEAADADSEVVVARSCEGGATNGMANLCF